MARQHDAELCERIRVLEERVKELEERPHTTYVPAFPHYCYWGCPIHYGTGTNPWPQFTWTVTNGTMTTAKGITTDGTYTIGDIA